MESYSSTLERFDSKLWGHHFKVKQTDGDLYVEGSNRRVICKLNNSIEFPCALMPFREGGYFINVNKEIRSKLRLSVGDPVSFTLKKDNSKYGMPMPEEMSELLKIDDEASTYFHALTPGKQRNLIYIIGKPKSSSIRLNKALAITEFLKENKGLLDFKLLNSFMKDFNKL